MEIDALEIFLSVATLGNFSRAAKSRNVAVSSVTRKIDLLEQDIGTALFYRSPRQVHLTDAGLQFVSAAKKILAEIDDVRDAIVSMQTEPQGVLTVTAPATFGRRHVAPAVAKFLLRYPQMQVDLHVSDDMVDLVNQRVDVAIRIGVLDDSDLLATKLAPQRRVAVASPAYLARAGRPTSPIDLLTHNCLSHGTHGARGTRAGWWQFAGVNDGKALDVNGNLRTDDSESLLKAVLAGVGIAHLATWLVGDEIAAGRLVMLFDNELREPPVSASGIHAMRMPGRGVRKATLFINDLREQFAVDDGGVPYWDRPFSR
ncbi:LysR family transcriptional regulator [Trinickia acidisoli]|uniref:LysR family transcriptional regulator n=1 Tax=Trinickia acidisoli TaxID=2767482 RepID=UPI001A8FD70C|nr:LysR family transcriptional regulator [Trinickia acidisoli]